MTWFVLFKRDPAAMVTTETQIDIRPAGPFSWDAALDVLAGWAPVRRHRPARRELTRIAFPLDGEFTPVAVALWWEDGVLRGDVTGSDRLDAVARQVARTFSLDHDGTGFPAVGERDPELGRVMAALPGLRPVCFTSPYEAAAWAVICGGTSMARAAAVQDHLLAAHGHRLRAGGADVLAFPEPDRLLSAGTLPGLGAEKVERLRGVARAALDGLLDADRLRALGPDAAPASVRGIRGIGEFWSQGIYLRGCGVVDVFPDEPLSVAALGHLHGQGDRPAPDVLQVLTEPLRPYRMWACFLLRVAAGRGIVPGVAGREGAIRRPSAARRPARR
jgi:DNA-3-methyladenine glycosylase II